METKYGQVYCLVTSKGRVCLGDGKRADTILGKAAEVEQVQFKGTSGPTTIYTYKFPGTGVICRVAHHKEGVIIHLDCTGLKR